MWDNALPPLSDGVFLVQVPPSTNALEWGVFLVRVPPLTNTLLKKRAVA
jgi:hypothetical protein